MYECCDDQIKGLIGDGWSGVKKRMFPPSSELFQVVEPMVIACLMAFPSSQVLYWSVPICPQCSDLFLRLGKTLTLAAILHQ